MKKTRPVAGCIAYTRHVIWSEGLRAQPAAGSPQRALLLAAAIVAGGAQYALAADGMGSSPDAIPPSVSQFFRSLARTNAAPARRSVPGALIIDSARLRVSFSGSAWGDVALYTARTTRGVCWVMVRGGRLSGECSGDDVPAGSLVVVGYDANQAGANLVDGHTYSSKARSLRVHFKHGSTLDVPVSGRFFVFELGLDHSSRSADPPVSLDVLDAAGRELGSRLDPLHLRARATAGGSSGSTTLPMGGSSAFVGGQV